MRGKTHDSNLELLGHFFDNISSEKYVLIQGVYKTTVDEKRHYVILYNDISI